MLFNLVHYLYALLISLLNLITLVYILVHLLVVHEVLLLLLCSHVNSAVPVSFRSRHPLDRTEMIYTCYLHFAFTLAFLCLQLGLQLNLRC